MFTVRYNAFLNKVCTNFLFPRSYTCRSVRASGSFSLLDFRIVLSTSHMPVMSRGPMFSALYSMVSYHLSFILRANQALVLNLGSVAFWLCYTVVYDRCSTVSSASAHSSQKDIRCQTRSSAKRTLYIAQ